MNILIAKTILQQWIVDEQIALFPNDAAGNFFELWDIASDDQNEEILECLKLIEDLRMAHILENKY